MKRVTILFVLVVLLVFSVQLSLAQGSDESPLKDQAWVRMGGPIGGLGYDIRMRPDNPDIMYVTDAWAGVHISTNGGYTWESNNEGIDARTGPSGDSVPVFCLTIDPNNHDILWIGTSSFKGIYRSENGGTSWEKRVNGIVEGGELTVRGFAVQPGNSDVVYVAGEIAQNNQGREFDRQKGVVYKSVDGGMHWKAVWRGNSLARYVLIDPNNVDIVYVSTGIFDREAANSDPDSNTAGGEGVLKSFDGGETWQPVNEGMRNLYVGSLFMHPENPNILLAGTGNNAYFNGGGVYLTENGGESWQHVGGEHIQSVEFSKSNPEIAYAAGSGEFLRSEDGGHTWENIAHARGWGWGPDGIRPGFPIDFQVDPRNPDRIFVNNYGGGNFLSEDGGRTWISASVGYTGADLSDVAVDPMNPAVVYVNGRSGPFRSVNGGVDWDGINPIEVRDIAEGARIAVSPSQPDRVLLSSAHWGWTYVSDAMGDNWRLATDYGEQLQNLPYADVNKKFQGMQAITFAPSDPQYVYGGFGIWRSASDGDICDVSPLYMIFTSEDGGQNWMVQDGAAVIDATVTEIVVHATQAEIAWASTVGGGVHKTIDGGKTWNAFSSGLRDQRVMSLAGDPTNSEVLYAGTLQTGLYKSVDGGASWVPSNIGMDPNESIGAIVVDPLRPNVVYAGSFFSGIYLSEDGGATWHLHNEGLRTRSVRQLALSSDGETLYAATRGEGMFRLSIYDQAYFDGLAPELPQTVPPESPPVESEDQPAGEPEEDLTMDPDDESTKPSYGLPCLGSMAIPFLFLGLVGILRKRVVFSA